MKELQTTRILSDQPVQFSDDVLDDGANYIDDDDNCRAKTWRET